MALVGAGEARGNTGEIDPSFGVNGYARAEDRFLIESAAFDGVEQADGKLLVTGYMTGSDGRQQPVVVRLTTTATLDPTWGVNGVATFDPDANGSEWGYAIALRSDGRVVITGQSDTRDQILVARFTSSGVLDTSFQSIGYQWYTAGGVAATGYGVAVRSSDNAIFVAASRTSTSGDTEAAVLALLSTGSEILPGGGATVFASFNTAGLQDEFRDVVIDPGGTITATGMVGGDLAFGRVTSAGTVDSTFGGGDGLVTLDEAGATEYGIDLARAPDGTYWSFGGNSNNVHAAHVSTTGVPDAAFGGNGIAAGSSTMANGGFVNAGGLPYTVGGCCYAGVLTRWTATGTTSTFASFTTEVIDDLNPGIGTGIQLASGGYAVFASADTHSGVLFAVVKLTAGGALDTTWSGDGRAQFALGDYKSAAVNSAWALQSDGRIRAARWNVGANYPLHRRSIGYGGITSSLTSQVMITATGAADSSFDGDGVSITRAYNGSYYYPDDARAGPSGSVYQSAGANLFGPAIYRYDSSGALDPGWNGTGFLNFGTSADKAITFDVDASNRVVVATRRSATAIHVERRTSTGAPDTGFNGTGSYDVTGTVTSYYTTIAAGPANDVWVAWGDDLGSVNVLHLTAAGAPDTTFGGADGIVTINPLTASSSEGPMHLVAQGTGVLVFAGTTNSNALVRLTSTGIPDPGFATSGTYIYPSARPLDLDLRADGRIVALYDMNFGTDASRVVMLSASGVVDTAWNGDGVLGLPQGGSEVLPMADGRMYLAGVAIPGETGVQGVVRLGIVGAPNVPTLVAPAANATGVSNLPTLSAQYSDGENNNGTVTFQVCSDALCNVVVATVTSSNTSNGNTASAALGTALVDGVTYWWRARATDSGGNQSIYSATRQFTTARTLIRATEDSSFVIRADGTLWRVSDGRQGQYGTQVGGATVRSEDPVQVYRSSGVPFTNVADVADMNFYTFVVLKDGTLWRQNHTNSATPPAFVQQEQSAGVPMTGVASVEGNWARISILKTNGTLYSWGWYVGDGTSNQYPYPVQVLTGPGTPLTNVTSVSVGHDVTLASTSSGTAWSWGEGSATQRVLGQGPLTTSLYAAQIRTSASSFLTGVAEVEMSPFDGLARLTTGQIVRWNTASGGYAVPMTGPNGSGVEPVTSIEAHRDWLFAIGTSGQLWYGNPTSNNLARWAAEPSVESVSMSPRGSGTGTDYVNHVLIRRTDGTIRAMSTNQRGEAVNCSTAPVFTFVTIVWSCGAGNHGPWVPEQLGIYGPDNTTDITGTYIRHGVTDSIHIAHAGIDQDASQTLTPIVRIGPGTAFLEYEAACSTATSGTAALPSYSTGASNVATAGTRRSVTGLTDGQMYAYGACVVDQSGRPSGWTYGIFYVDVSPPAAPAWVNDGSGADIDSQTSNTTIEYNHASVATDPGSYVAGYHSCVTTSSTGADCATTAARAWTPTSGNPDLVLVGLAGSTTYYVCVRTRDAAGNTSAATCSDGVFINVPAPVITDNQSGDTTWRNVNSGTYDVDFTATSGTITNFQTRVWTATGQTGSMRQDWTTVASPGTATYSTNWSLPASTWTALQEGVNWISVRATNTYPATTTTNDVFEVRKDTIAPPAVSTLSASSPTTSQPSLTWTSVTDATSGIAYYSVYRSTTGCAGGFTKISTDGTVTGTGPYVDSGAPWTSTLCYRVQAIDLAGNEQASGNASRAVIYHRPPAVPTLVSPAPAATNQPVSPSLTATHVDPDLDTGTISFDVCADSSCSSVIASGVSGAALASGSNGSWLTSPALNPTTTYWWRAMATDFHGATSAWSAIRSFTTGSPPAAPSNVSPANAGTGQSTTPTLSAGFSDPDGGTGTITFDVCSNATCTAIITSGTSSSVTSGSTASWVVDTSLAGATTYWWRARATDATGLQSATYGSIWSFTTLVAPTIIDNQPGDLTWRSTNSGVFDVDASTAAGTISTIEVRVWNAAGQSGTMLQDWTIAVSPGVANYTTNWSLPASTWAALAEGVNFVSIRASNSGGASSTLVDAFEVRRDTVATPTTTVRDGSAAPDLQWSNATASLAANWPAVTDAGAGLDRYEYCMSTGAGCTGTILTTPTWTSNATSTLATRAGTYSHGSTYFTTIRTIDALANVSTTEPSNGVTIDTVAPTSVTGTSGTSPTTSSPSISWTAATDALSGVNYYRVYRSSSAGSLGSQVNVDGATTGTSFTDVGNATSGTWYYTVQAVDRAGNEQTVGNAAATIVFTAPIYLRATNTALTGAWLLSPTPGSTADTATILRHETKTGWMQFAAGTTNDPTGGAGAPSSYTGSGWLLDPSAGRSFQAGTWTHHVTTDATHAHTGYLNLRTWKVTLSGGAISTGTPLTAWVEHPTNLGAGTATVTHDVAVPMPSVTFAAGEYLYVEYWERVTVAASGGGSANARVTFTVDTASQYIETTAPIPPVTVGSVDDTAVAQSTSSAPITITGTGFQSGATVTLAGTGATFNVTSVTSTTITGTLTVSSSATLGARTLTVTNPDLSSASLAGAITITTPSLTIGLSTLGFSDAARDNASPYAIDFGLLGPGLTRSIGPAASGQTLAGAAIIVSTSADSDHLLSATATQFSSGGNTIPVANFERRHFGTAEAWSAWPTTTTSMEGTLAPGTRNFSYDTRLTLPAGQAAGSYSSTLTWSLVAAP